jgi:hypothetical protein
VSGPYRPLPVVQPPVTYGPAVCFRCSYLMNVNGHYWCSLGGAVRRDPVTGMRSFVGAVPCAQRNADGYCPAYKPRIIFRVLSAIGRALVAVFLRFRLVAPLAPLPPEISSLRLGPG